MTDDALTRAHPASSFFYLVSAVCFGALTDHPLFTAVSLLTAGAYFVLLSGSRGIRQTAQLMPLALLIALINPLFNTRGETVLFELFRRPYTLEALFCGGVTAATFLSAMLWFGCLFRVMGREKLIYLLRRIAPSLSMLTVMTVRLVPDVARRAKDASSSRRVIGKGISSSGFVKKIKSGASFLGAAVSRELERGITTGDSMRARGYGTAKRSSFEKYRMNATSVVLLSVTVLALACFISYFVAAGTGVSYFPTVTFAPPSAQDSAVFIFYLMYLSIPAALHIKELLVWKFSKYKI